MEVSNVDADAQNKPPNAEKKAKKAKKDGKQIGLLVKAIEEWEFNLIKLTRNCTVPLWLTMLRCQAYWLNPGCTHAVHATISNVM